MAAKDSDECLIAEDEWEAGACTSGGDTTRSVEARHWAEWNGSMWHVVAEPTGERPEPKESRRRDVGPCAGPVAVNRAAAAWTVLRDEDEK